MSVAVAMLAVGIASSVLGAAGDKKAAEAEKGASMRQAELLREQTTEGARRLSMTQERTESEAVAGTYASGIQMSGSNESYIRSMQTEHAKELSWMKSAGEMEATAIEEGAAVTEKSRRLSRASNLAGGVAKSGMAFLGA